MVCYSVIGILVNISVVEPIKRDSQHYLRTTLTLRIHGDNLRELFFN